MGNILVFLNFELAVVYFFNHRDAMGIHFHVVLVLFLLTSYFRTSNWIARTLIILILRHVNVFCNMFGGGHWGVFNAVISQVNFVNYHSF